MEMQIQAQISHLKLQVTAKIFCRSWVLNICDEWIRETCLNVAWCKLIQNLFLAYRYSSLYYIHKYDSGAKLTFMAWDIVNRLFWKKHLLSLHSICQMSSAILVSMQHLSPELILRRQTADSTISSLFSRTVPRVVLISAFKPTCV